MKRNAPLICFFILSLAIAVHASLCYWRGEQDHRGVEMLLGAAQIICLVLWAKADSKQHQEVWRPFDYGLLVLLFWIPYLPYYLWRTRGAKGLAIFAGFVLLMCSGVIAPYLLYLFLLAGQ